MKQHRYLRLLLPLLFLLPQLHLQADEVSDLRAENARLRAQLEAMKGKDATAVSAPGAQQTVAPPTIPPPTTGPATSTPAPTTAPVVAAPVAPSAPASASAPAPAPAPTMTAPAVAPSAATPAAPPGYKLVPLEPEGPPYMNTGCSRSAFLGPPPAPWLDVDAWNGLRRGMAPADVEAAIGVEHHDVQAQGMTQWQYGRCGDSVGGWVLFQGGRVRSWSAPDR